MKIEEHEGSDTPSNERLQPTELQPMQIRIDTDVRSGHMVGRHEVAVDDEVANDVAGNVVQIISTMLLKREACIAKAISCHTQQGNYLKAAELFLNEDTKMVIQMAPGDQLFEAAIKIERSELKEPDRFDFLRHIIGLASKIGKHAPVFHHIKELMENPAIDDEWQHALKNTLGIAELERGAPEAALKIWKSLLEEVDRIEPGQRAWVYRNIAFVYRAKGDAVACRRARENYRLSIDASLEAGQTRDAIDTLIHLSKLLEEASLDDAIDQFDRMLSLVGKEGPLDDEIAALIYHLKSQRLFSARLDSQAKVSALKAVSLLRGLHGAEEQLISSLYLAQIVAEAEGDDEVLIACRLEASRLEEQTGSAHFVLAKRAKKLLEEFDETEVAQLLADVEQSGYTNLIAGTRVAAIIQNPKLSNLEKLAEFEIWHTRLKDMKVETRLLTPVRLAIATVLKELDDFEAAACWYQKILSDDPLDAQTAHSLVDALWKDEQWGEAAIELAKQMERFGNGPGYLYAYGRSLYEAGDLSKAVLALTQAQQHSNLDEEMRLAVRELREKAFDLGGTVIPEMLDLSPPPAVTFDHVCAALKDFSDFVSSAKRMDFWRRDKDNRKRKWISRPEKFGQTLLHTFLKARFSTSAQIFEEISVGAGRLDVLAQFAGGLRVIIELKMCGTGYSTSYAQSGEDQICHYMDNEQVQIGVLLAFDARVQNNCESLVKGAASHQTIHEILVDVRPSVK